MTQNLKLAALTTLMMTTLACGRAQWQEAGAGTANGQGTQAQTPETPPQTPLDPGNPPPAGPPLKPGHYPPAAFDSCNSQTLTVEVLTSRTNKSSLQDFATTMARYPRVKVTPAVKKVTKSTFYLNASDANQHACQNKICAEQAGWSDVQNDLQDLNGVTVECMGAPKPVAPPPPAPTPQESGSGEGRG